MKTENPSIDDSLEGSGSFESRFEEKIERALAERSQPASGAAAPASNPSTLGSPSPEGLQVCTDCGHLGRPVTITRGTLQTELLLWLALLLPGILYSIWRLTTRSRGCELCHGCHVIPAESPIGRKLLAELEQ